MAVWNPPLPSPLVFYARDARHLIHRIFPDPSRQRGCIMKALPLIMSAAIGYGAGWSIHRKPLSWVEFQPYAIASGVIFHNVEGYMAPKGYGNPGAAKLDGIDLET